MAQKLSAELVSLLICPATRLPLQLVQGEELQRFNQKIAAGDVTTRGGLPVTAQLSGILVSADKRVAYPIRDGIPVLLISESFAFN